MQCPHFDAFRCRSCALMGVRYAAQLGDKAADSRATLSSVVPEDAWAAPFPSVESGFRNKAKLVVGGAPGAVTLGILDERRRGVDLRDCGLYEPSLAEALTRLADWLDDLRLLPYDVARRRGELKYVHVTVSPDAELMVRFVLRSDRQAPRVRAGVGELRAALPRLRVATINLLPEHVALLEGDEEELLTEDATLPMDLGRLTLHLGPRAFFQTNTAVATGLYEQAREWIGDVAPESLVDLYCGVGGFGLYAATLAAPPSVLGIEVSQDAVASAQHTAKGLRDSGIATGAVEFRADDAGSAMPDAECVVVNPPRRGIDPTLSAALEAGGADTLVYSSCNPGTLARDLAAMPSFTVRNARMFDMFPQTLHREVLVLAVR